MPLHRSDTGQYLSLNMHAPCDNRSQPPPGESILPSGKCRIKDVPPIALIEERPFGHPAGHLRKWPGCLNISIFTLWLLNPAGNGGHWPRPFSTKGNRCLAAPFCVGSPQDLRANSEVLDRKLCCHSAEYRVEKKPLSSLAQSLTGKPSWAFPGHTSVWNG